MFSRPPIFEAIDYSVFERTDMSLNLQHAKDIKHTFVVPIENRACGERETITSKASFTFLAGLEEISDQDMLWRLVLDSFALFGLDIVTYYTYHLDNCASKKVTKLSSGYPFSWKRACHKNGWSGIEINPGRIKSPAPFRWGDVENFHSLTDVEQSLFNAINRTEFGNGYAIPVFGGRVTNGMMCLSAVNGSQVLDAMTAPTIMQLNCIAQQAHLKFVELQGRGARNDVTALSPREAEILQWVARGKSNSVIADITKITVHTVNAHVRRIYAKLGVNDRTMAVVRGLSLGLIW